MLICSNIQVDIGLGNVIESDDDIAAPEEMVGGFDLVGACVLLKRVSFAIY